MRMLALVWQCSGRRVRSWLTNLGGEPELGQCIAVWDGEGQPMRVIRVSHLPGHPTVGAVVQVVQLSSGDRPSEKQ